MEETEEERNSKLREMEIELELEEMKDEVPNLSNIGRRASISLPAGLDLLLQITEYTWETRDKNRRDSLADSLVKSAAQNVKRDPNYCNAIIRSESEIELSELSEMDQSPSNSPGPSQSSESKKKRRVGVSQGPKINISDDPDEIEFRQHASKRSLAGRRKSGIIPLKIMNSNYLKSNPEEEEEEKMPLNSPQNIKNFIKGKFSAMSVPGVLKRRKPPGEYKLHAFVALLLLVILLLVGSIYVIHKEKELQKAHYEQIRFSAKDRKIRVSNWRGKEVLSGTLGWTMTKKDKAWPCLPIHQKENQNCLEWMNKARLYFSTVETNGKKESSDWHGKQNIQCYGVFWESLNPNYEVKDCFDLSTAKGTFWYGGGEMGSNQWPLNRTFIPLSPFTTGNNIASKEWGRTMHRLFVSAPGAALKVPFDTPLFVSINEEPNYLCISAKQNQFAYPGAVNNLNYTICTGDSVKEMSIYLADKDIWDGLKHEDVHSTYALALSPIWRIHSDVLGNISEASLLNHTDRIAALHISEGYILLDESWQKNIGDLEVDSDRFPTMVETFDISRRRGFKVALTIQPFFSTESKNYLEALPLNLWAKERETKRVPALTQFKNYSPGFFALLDVTNGAARRWFEGKVGRLVEKYKIEALFAEVGTATDFPHYYEFQERLSSLDYYKELFLKALRVVPNVKTIGLSSAVKLPKLPTFVALSPTERSWEGLQSIIPNILTLGVTGFPFIIPGSIGGDHGGTKPDRDLYMRWLQLSHFLPVVQYSFLPSDYDGIVVELATKMNQIRKKKLFPYLKKAIDEALTSGLGMIRPLWLIDPNDPNCLKVWDEFSIGGDIIVAPVIKPNATERDIYLPKGKWKDELDGSSTKGEKWLHNYRVRQNQIAFFTKIPDGPN